MGTTSKTVIGSDTTNPPDGYVLAWVAANNEWEPTDPASIVAGASNPTGPAGGDLSSTYPNPTVAKIQNRDISNAAPTDGYALVWVASNNDWEPRAVTGSAAPATTGTLGTIQLAGDLGGVATAPNVLNIHGAVVPIAGSLVTGNVLQVNGASSLTYSAVNLAGGVNFVTGVLPTGNQAAQTMGGDVSGTTAASTVIKLQTRSVASTAPTDGYVLTWVAANNDWEPKPGSGGGAPSGPASGDLSGTYPGPTVAKVNGATTPAAGALTTGNVLQVNGASSLTYGAINLAGGANFVTGTLPSGNLPSATTGALGIIQLASDLGGTATSPSVLSIHGATVPLAGSLTTGNVLQVSGSSALSYAAINLAGGTNFVTGVLPTGNQAAQTMAGDVTGTTAASVVAKANGATVPAAGSLTTGNVLQVSGTSALSYAAINLAGGANFVTGVLPTGNQAAQTMGGDVTGTTAASTVAKLQGRNVAATAPTDGYALTWVAGNNDWEPIIASATVNTVQTGRNYGNYLLVNPFPGTTNTASTTFVVAGTFEFDPSAITAANGVRNIILKVIAETTAPLMTIQLFNFTTNTMVTGSTLTTSSLTPDPLSTSDLTSNLSVGNAIYQIQIQMASGSVSDRVTLDWAVLRIDWS